MNWYALHSRSNCEKLVRTALAERGIEGFWPALKVKRKLAGKEYTVEKALFPGYVFARFEWSKRLPVITIPQVVRVLSVQGQAIAIPESEIEGVRQILTAPPATIAAHPYVRLGEWVRVTRGPLIGTEGFVSVIRGQYRVVVSVHMLGRSVSAEVDADALEPSFVAA